MVSKSVIVSPSHFDQSVCKLPLDPDAVPRMVDMEVVIEDANGLLRVELGAEQGQSVPFERGHELLAILVGGGGGHFEHLV